MRINLTTKYLGLELASPLVASSSPLTGKIDSLRQLEDAGASAVVLPSLFEEQLEHEAVEVAKLLELQADSFAESLNYFPELESYNTGPNEYLELIASARDSLSIPVVASLNGCSPGGWTRYASEMEQAGACALELNIYHIPTDAAQDSNAVDQTYADLVAAVRQEVTVPLAVKVGPYFSSLPNLAANLVDAGADGLVLFNRYLEPDIDLETLEFVPDLLLSQPEELRLSLRWIAILRDQLSASLAATSGIHSADDAIKAILVGADVTMLASVLLKQGPGHLTQVKADLAQWLERHEYDSIEQMKGSMSKSRSSNPEGLERANYMKALTTYTSQTESVFRW